eukprot:585695-Rhodomonas_salina.2
MDTSVWRWVGAEGMGGRLGRDLVDDAEGVGEGVRDEGREGQVAHPAAHPPRTAARQRNTPHTQRSAEGAEGGEEKAGWRGEASG